MQDDYDEEPKLLSGQKCIIFCKEGGMRSRVGIKSSLYTTCMYLLVTQKNERPEKPVTTGLNISSTKKQKKKSKRWKSLHKKLFGRRINPHDVHDVAWTWGRWWSEWWTNSRVEPKFIESVALFSHLQQKVVASSLPLYHFFTLLNRNLWKEREREKERARETDFFPNHRMNCLLINRRLIENE